MAPKKPIRLFVESALAPGVSVALPEAQAHYARHVMRLGDGDALALFNGADGEWAAQLQLLGKKNAEARVGERLRAFKSVPDLWLLFAPIKHGPIDNLAQKATELGVSVLQPVLTQHTVVSRVNLDRLRANAVEAAEQSGRLCVPEVRAEVALPQLLAGWPQDRVLIYGDESGHGRPAAEALPALRGRKLAVLIGPEGGFSLAEHRLLRHAPGACAIGLGPRVMRADTAALAALTLVQAFAGDWPEQPNFNPQAE